ncbi:hypothetical protein CSHISOI_09679, partial [Colletotrichum shisoi]
LLRLVFPAASPVDRTLSVLGGHYTISFSSSGLWLRCIPILQRALRWTVPTLCIAADVQSSSRTFCNFAYILSRTIAANALATPAWACRLAPARYHGSSLRVFAASEAWIMTSGRNTAGTSTADRPNADAARSCAKTASTNIPRIAIWETSIPPPRVCQSGRLPSSLQRQMQGTEARTTEEGEMRPEMTQNHRNTPTDLVEDTRTSRSLVLVGDSPYFRPGGPTMNVSWMIFGSRTLGAAMWFFATEASLRDMTERLSKATRLR